MDGAREKGREILREMMGEGFVAATEGLANSGGVGSRIAARAIEDCYAIYYWLPKASIFAGWREMNDYMLANKLEVVQPRYEPPGSPQEMRRRRQARDDGGATGSAGEAGNGTGSDTASGGDKPDATAKDPAAPEEAGKDKAKPAAG